MTQSCPNATVSISRNFCYTRNSAPAWPIAAANGNEKLQLLTAEISKEDTVEVFMIFKLSAGK